jgi:hypothetical protein
MLLGVSLGKSGYLGFSVTVAGLVLPEGSCGCASDVAPELIDAISDSAIPPHKAKLHLAIPFSPVVLLMMVKSVFSVR